jgi:UDP-N-acetylmuramoyl-tripeptide--D-alanyl-D-alanine ligase
MMKIEHLYGLYKECKYISTDSRKLIPGSLFFALKGENFDGNCFALDALEKACSYAIVDDTSLPSNDRLLQFPDVLSTLQNLAKHHRYQLTIPFIGITGSNGKTTTKELIATVLSRKYKVCATQGNLNNHIGVPLTILSVDNHDIAIIEMGANHIGEIAALCKISNPDYGIITNIGKAHLEGFGSPEGVIKAKSELYDHLARHKAKAFIDAGNTLLRRLAKEKNLNTVFYGNALESACTGEITDNSEFLAARIHLALQDAEIDIQSSLVGEYNLNNMLAAACIGNFFGINSEDIASALTGYVPQNSRSQLMITLKNKIVLDAYNANPSSMEGSINNFLSLNEKLPKMIILGDMLELGKYSRSEHQAIIGLFDNKQPINVILVGPEFYAVSKSSSLPCFLIVEDLIEHFRTNPVKEHCILLKGSRKIRLKKLLEVL